MSPWWLMIPILSAFLGWLTIQLFVKLFFGFVFPRKRQQWTVQLAKTVSTELFSFADLETKITSPESLQKIMPQVEVHIDDFLRKGLPKSFPMISAFIGERTINQLKEIFLKELETIFPLVMKGYVKNLQEDLNLEQMVIDKVTAIPTDKIQVSVYQAIGSDLNKAALLAALLGLLIGLVQLGIVLATVSF
ncbi:DUF445 domain-containing protein [Paraflavitalea soli]|uniref:DUF445 domain-containing protein n=1 Tax=Paraflavitalea soli TaxID=2315862 RepID=A0A3B7MS81_9BACT|nr:DUF445 domain-containing protein [Paraflavitalea soli]AXY74485.1 DUF445 domain-containing protein [Paraflavitalea soli]